MIPGRMLLATALVLQPLVLLAAQTLHPAVEQDARSYADAVAEDPTRWALVHVLAVVAGLLFVPAAIGIASFARERGRRFAVAGVAAAAVSAVALAIGFGLEARLSATIDAAGGPENVRAAAEWVDAWPAVVLVAGLLAFVVAVLLLATAVVRARTLPLWVPALMLLGAVASIALPPGGELTWLTSIPMIVAFTYVAWKLAQTADARRERRDSNPRPPA